MARVHVVMAEGTSPIYFNVPYPVAVFRKKKLADKDAKRRNATARFRLYYVRPADMQDDGKDSP